MSAFDPAERGRTDALAALESADREAAGPDVLTRYLDQRSTLLAYLQGHLEGFASDHSDAELGAYVRAILAVLVERRVTP